MPLPCWGGVPFRMLSTHQAGFPFPLSFLPSSMQIFRQSGQIFGKKEQKLDFICSAWCFLGKIGDQKGQKLRYILISRGAGLPLWLSICGGGRVHWCMLAGPFRDSGPAGFGSGPLVVCPFLSSALSLCSWYVSPEYGSISRFKGVFRGFWGVDVYLYGLRSLRGLWGFCVREWLGGYMACGDFLQNLSFCPFVFLSCSAFVACFPWLPALLALLLFWLCGLVCLLGWVVGFLSLSDGFRHKKKGRNFLRPLLSCCGLLC